jgi:hypothetical protein
MPPSVASANMLKGKENSGFLSAGFQGSDTPIHVLTVLIQGNLAKPSDFSRYWRVWACGQNEQSQVAFRISLLTLHRAADGREGRNRCKAEVRPGDLLSQVSAGACKDRTGSTISAMLRYELQRLDSGKEKVATSHRLSE